MTEETLFAFALEKPSGADRQAYLDAACGGDARLRDRVERLLAADERSRGIIDRGPDPAALLAVCLPPGKAPSAAFPLVIQEAESPRYERADEVGEGGMGVVYRARDARLARDVAVKILHPRYAADGPAAKRFLGEARVTAQLQHPGVPPVHQVGALPDGRPFLVMKLIKGRTLADLLADGRTDRGHLLASFEQVCHAVAYAHDNGVIHRDLKPSNVMVGAFGEVQVMDWGLAKVLASRSRDESRCSDEQRLSSHEQRERPEDERGDPTTPPEAAASAIDSDRGEGDATRAGSVLGSPAYMPPEQATGSVDQIDARSDVFGLGAILCAALTGQPPYVGEDFESTRQLAARARLGDAFARLDRCGAEPELIELCKRCLAPEKADRPADAGEVARAVHDLRAAADERARVAELDRAKAEAESREQRKRHRVQRALFAALALLLAGGGAFGWYSDLQATKQRIEAEGRRRQNAAEVAALLDQCQVALEADRADRALVALEAAERRAAEGGAEEWADRLAAYRADLTLLRELDAIDAFRWTVSQGQVPAPAAVVARWRVALSAYGLTPAEGPAEAAAARIGRSMVKDRLLAALDLWLSLEPSAGVRAVLRSADPDAYRDAVRDALANGDQATVVTMIGRRDTLAQPPRFAAVLGQLGWVAAVARRGVLESALRARPGDLALIMVMASSYPTTGAEWAGERVRWYQAAVAVNPDNPAAHHNLGIALWTRGDPGGTIGVYREALRLDPHDGRARRNLELALRENRDLDAAIAELREAVRLSGELGFARSSLGVSLWAKGDPDEAVVHLRKAVRLDPADPLAHYNLGLVLRDLGNLNGALAEYEEAVRLDPRDARARNNLGVLLAGKRDLDAAVTHLGEAVRLSPNYARARNNLGSALAQKKNPGAAVAEFRWAVSLDPNYASAFCNLGQALWEIREPGAALVALRRAVALDPDSAYARHNLGVALGQKGDFDGALAELRSAAELEPKNATTQRNLAAARRATGDLVGAVDSLRRATEADGKDPRTHDILAWLLATGPDNIRDGKRAVEHATQACELTRWQSAVFLGTLAAAHAEAGEFDKAVEVQKQALASPNFPPRLAKEGSERLERYTQNKPHRDPSLVRRQVAPPPRELKREGRGRR